VAVVDDAHAAESRLRPPSLFLMLAEARSVFELNSSLLLAPLLLRAPRGDGHPVLALPGFLASDLSMVPMRRFLKELGYDTYAWKMGRNFGGVAGKRAGLRDLLTEIHQTTGRKVSIIGWSLGGIYARDLALHRLDDLGAAMAGIDAPEASRAVEDLPPVMRGVVHVLGGDEQARIALELAIRRERHPVGFEIVGDAGQRRIVGLVHHRLQWERLGRGGATITRAVA